MIVRNDYFRVWILFFYPGESAGNIALVHYPFVERPYACNLGGQHLFSYRIAHHYFYRFKIW